MVTSLVSKATFPLKSTIWLLRQLCTGFTLKASSLKKNMSLQPELFRLLRKNLWPQKYLRAGCVGELGPSDFNTRLSSASLTISWTASSLTLYFLATACMEVVDFVSEFFLILATVLPEVAVHDLPLRFCYLSFCCFTLSTVTWDTSSISIMVEMLAPAWSKHDTSRHFVCLLKMRWFLSKHK